ncbi:MAG: AAA family ATPase [Deltaproteobacteria bacterium]|nr:AAA family ATPase [Deltaproteobacteria bacterium]
MIVSDGWLHDEDAERGLCGCAIYDQQVLQECADYVEARDFYEPHLREIWSAMVSLHKSGADVDAVTISGELRSRRKYDQVGGAPFLDALLDAVPPLGHADEYAKRIATASKHRRTRAAAERLRLVLEDPAVSEEAIERSIIAVRREAEGSVHELPAVTLEDLEAIERPRGGKWLVHGWWTQQGCGLIAGDPKSNKSLLALALCMSIASGEPFLRRWQVDVSGPTLYIGEEDDQWTVKDRSRKLRRALAISDVRRRMFIACQQGADITSQRGRGRVSALVRRIRPVFTVIDTWGRCAERVDLNSYREVMEHLGYLRRLSAEVGTAIMIVHHLKKTDFNRPTEHITARALGSQAFWGWSDDFIGVERPGKKKLDDGKRHISAYHRAAGEMEPQEIIVKWDDERDEVRIAIGEPPAGSSTQAELGDVF